MLKLPSQLLLLFASLSVSATAAAGPIGSPVIANGNGCPSGSFNVFTSADGQALRIQFDEITEDSDILLDAFFDAVSAGVGCYVVTGESTSTGFVLASVSVPALGGTLMGDVGAVVAEGKLLARVVRN